MSKIFFIFILLIFQTTFINSLMDYESEHFYCSGRIYSDNNGLSQQEINSLCTKITSDDRYVILFTNKDRFRDEKSYSYNSEDFFSSHCIANKIDCKYDFSICIYLWGGKVIITSGSKSKNIVTQNNRMNVINNMIPYLTKGEYYTAINNALTELTNLYYKNNGPSSNVQPRKESNHSTFIVFFFILICLCCCVCCYFIYRNQQKSNEELTYTQIIENEKIGSYNNSNFDQSLQIHNHLTSLEKIIEEIKRSDPQIKETNQCLICMQPIINTVGTVETGNTRFACQHVYHSACLSKYNLNCCLMCKDIANNASVIVPNYHDTQVLSEEQVKNFIKNIQNIYPPKELRIYSQRYPQEYNNFNDGLMLGLLATSWCMPPPVMVINNNPYGYGYGMGYNNNYDYNNNYNPPPQNYYDGNPNPDSAVGGFQSNNNNIEMNEINNNNNNAGGNFGGFGNNNTNDGGDFGGGDFDTGGDF